MSPAPGRWWQSAPCRAHRPGGGGTRTRRVSSRLVGRLGACEPETVKRGNRFVVDLEKPESQPPLLEGLRGEVTVKRRREEEGCGVVPPALAVQMEENVEVSRETLGIRGEAIRHRSELGQLARKAAHLLAEVAPPLPQELVPRVVFEAQYRTGLAVQGATSGQLPEALIAGDLLGEQYKAAQRNAAHGLPDAGGGSRFGERCADGSELVARAVSDEPHHGNAALPPLVQRHDRNQIAVGTCDSDELPARPPVMTPPRQEPLACREDVPGSLREAPPLRGLHGVERGC